MIDTDIKLQWHLDSLPAGSVAPLQGFFDQLPVDPYIQGRFRERRYGRVEKEGSRFYPLDNGVFFQAAAINKFLGDVPRTYAELDPAFVAHPTFQLMLARFARHTRLADGQAIGIHQMRIVTGEGESVPPAPEGVHQDGFDFIKKAQREYASFTQEQVDKIFRAAALAAADARIPLAKMAVAESGMGIVEDKVIKNHFASEYIYNAYKDEKTCGVLSEDDTFGTITIAEPIGIICGIVPTTNPTSTAIFKSLISLKTRNAIIFSPHPRAKDATNKAADIVLQAAIAAGAPKDLIGWIDQPSVELSNALMHHPDINLILATGGPGMVKAAYSSGKPAIGVGAGNTPVVIDETADIKRAVASVLMSKTFDNGVICASEQSVVVVDSVYDAVRERFATHGGYLLQGKELKAVQDVILKNGALNAAIVGQPAYKIAELAGFSVPENTKILIGEVTVVDESEPFAHEKLSPTLAMYRAKDFEDAVEKAEKLVAMGGIGHTSCLYTDQDNQPARVSYFGQKMKTARILINTPASQGGIGDLYNFKLAPSLTLGCGSWGGNSISENVGPKHLINKKTVAKRAENMLWHKLPKSIYFRRGSLPIALDEVITDGHKRALIVTDRFLFNNGYADQITSVLKAAGVETEVFFEVEADPTLSIVRKGAELANSFKPDVIIALGGGSPMDAAKIMWVMYEHPETHFEELALRFMDIRKRIYKFPKMGVKAKMIAVTTTSGTGSEVTPFAVVTDDATGQKYPLADYAALRIWRLSTPTWLWTCRSPCVLSVVWTQ